MKETFYLRIGTEAAVSRVVLTQMFAVQVLQFSFVIYKLCFDYTGRWEGVAIIAFSCCLAVYLKQPSTLPKRRHSRWEITS